LDWINLQSVTMRQYLATTLVVVMGHVEHGRLDEVAEVLRRDPTYTESVALATAGFAGWMQGSKAMGSGTAAKLCRAATSVVSPETARLCRHAREKARRYLVPQPRASYDLQSRYPNWIMVGSPIGLGRIVGEDEASRHMPFVEELVEVDEAA
jgi:hypothetical protein